MKGMANQIECNKEDYMTFRGIKMKAEVYQAKKNFNK